MISKHKIKPNTVLYNALLKGYAELGDTKSAFRLFNNVSKKLQVSVEVGAGVEFDFVLYYEFFCLA